MFEDREHESTENEKKIIGKMGSTCGSNQHASYFDVGSQRWAVALSIFFFMYFSKLWYINITGIIHLLDLRAMETKANECNSINFPNCSQVIEKYARTIIKSHRYVIQYSGDIQYIVTICIHNGDDGWHDSITVARMLAANKHLTIYTTNNILQIIYYK